ncbi:mycothiol transferase [Streptomyces violascens]
MAEVKRNWFRRVFAGEQDPPIYDPQADTHGHGGGFELAKGTTLHGALATWQAEITRSREHCANRALTDTGRFMDQDVSLRWIYVRTIERPPPRPRRSAPGTHRRHHRRMTPDQAAFAPATTAHRRRSSA